MGKIINLNPGMDFEALKKKHHWVSRGIYLEDAIKTRLISGEHAPNGTEELLAWLLIKIDQGVEKDRYISELETANNELAVERDALEEVVEDYGSKK